MKKLISTIVILSLALPLLLAQRNKETITKNIFKNTPILFNPTEYPNGVVEKENNIYLGNGRIALTKINIPNYSNYTKAKITSQQLN